MLVKYKKMNIFNICIPHEKKNGKAASGDIVKVIPGLNKIEDKHWKVAKDNPKVKYLLESGDLVVVTEKDGGSIDENKDKQVAPELASMKAADAVNVVGECMDKDLLDKWLGEEERVSVRRKIETQLKSLELTQEEKDAQQ